MRSPFRAPASTRRGARWSRCEPYVARPTEKRNSSDVAHDLVGALLNMGDGETYRIVTCASIMGGERARARERGARLRHRLRFPHLRHRQACVVHPLHNAKPSACPARLTCWNTRTGWCSRTRARSSPRPSRPRWKAATSPLTAAWQSAREWGSACRSRRRAQSQPRARLHVPLAFAFLAWSSFRHRDLN